MVYHGENGAFKTFSENKSISNLQLNAIFFFFFRAGCHFLIIQILQLNWDDDERLIPS